jgi:hypothetical protein
MARPKKNAMDAAIEQQDQSLSVVENPIEQAPIDHDDITIEDNNNVEYLSEDFPHNDQIPVNNEENVFNEEEIKAIDSGWTPKSVYKGDPANWRDAKTWNERNRALSAIEQQRQEIAELKKSQLETKDQKGRKRKLILLKLKEKQL